MKSNIKMRALAHERDQLKNLSEKQAIEIEELRSQNSSLTERFETTKNNLENKLKEIQTNYMNDKSKFETNIALLQQKKDFAELKIT